MYIITIPIGICTVAVLDTLESTEGILKEFFLCHDPGSCGIVQHKETTQSDFIFSLHQISVATHVATHNKDESRWKLNGLGLD